MQRIPVARSIMRGAVARPSHHNGQRMLACRALLSTSTGDHRGGNANMTSKTTPGSSIPTPQQKKTTTAGAEEVGSGNPELPKFSLDGLGVSRNMKVFLIVVLSIFGTMETWLYCKAVWRWWYGEQGLAVKGDDK
ncbi:hypothetical protein ISF_02667 [Cordyceps fumosorosea ARSEF 2679]|uniref:Uncharacterized protein n=1 Tax=Cordyceps fumosorosea (strain ARSEF 2679) TaxID=1081104 RepID=A0A168BY12_CORFA|nr:hypothetical protein ISF_02667 [Cordyceps fumosorosea ARSEF 2679]OAA70693.1 hypothetical protein ISF_02667 [Cordyceps fumosorosea ARSEF 2679]